MTLAEIGENRLLDRLLPRLPSTRLVKVPAGDDCAAVKGPDPRQLLLLKTDVVVEGVHFTSETEARLVGWKAMARPLSDFAAMSGIPQFALVTLLLPASTEVSWVRRLYQGLSRAARRFDVAIVGGETSSTSNAAAVSVSVAGTVESERCITRGGGKAGDVLCVTGKLGGSICGKHLRFTPRIAEARWLTAHFKVNAMLDLSDGLGADLPRLARASGLGFTLDTDAIPRNRGCTIEDALTHGEDFELLFSVREEIAARLIAKWRKRWPLQLTPIGRLAKQWTRKDTLPSGYVHFT